MAVTNLSDHPSLSNPERRKEVTLARLEHMDGNITLLGFLADAIIDGKQSDEFLAAIEHLHRELKRDCDTLIAIA